MALSSSRVSLPRLVILSPQEEFGLLNDRVLGVVVSGSACRATAAEHPSNKRAARCFDRLLIDAAGSSGEGRERRAVHVLHVE